jgi:hypothetical protein
MLIATTGEDDMEMLLTIHSAVRWAILAVAALALIKLTIGWAGGGAFKGLDRGLLSGFSGLMDLQVLTGLIYFFWNGSAAAGFPFFRILHLIVMIAAAGLAHVPARLQGLNDRLRFQYSIYALVGSLALVLIGIMILPGGLAA